MFFIFRDKGRTFFPATPEHKVIQSDTGSILVRNPRPSIRVQPVTGGGFVNDALPVKSGRKELEGYFDSADDKYRKNMTQEEAEEFLINHKDYGQDFIALDAEGKAVTPLGWNSPGKRSEQFLSQSGEGKYCTLCDKQIDIRGLHKHVDSKAHLELLGQAEKLAVKKLQVEGRA